MKNRKSYISFGVLTVVLISGISIYLLNGNQNNVESSSNISQSEQFDNSEVFVSSDYISYDSTEDLYEASDSVIVGKVLSYIDTSLNIVMTEEQINQLEDLTEMEKKDLINSSKTPEYFPYRIFDVKITENYKGEHAPGDIIKVKQLYGKIDNAFYNNEFLLNIDNEYMLFLEHYPNSPSSLLNQEQASYYVKKDITNEEILEPVNKANKKIKMNKKKVKDIKTQNKNK